MAGTVAETVAEMANRKLYGFVYSRKTTGKFEPCEIAKDDDLIIGSLPKEMMRKVLSERSSITRCKEAFRLSEQYNVEGKGRTEMVTMKEDSKAECSNQDSQIGEGVCIGNGRTVENNNINTPMKRKRGADGEIVCAFLLSPTKSLSRLRPRKDVPAFRMVNMEEKDNELVVGKRIKVYWPDSRRWFTGHIVDFDNKNKLRRVLYEDGDKELLDLRKEQFQLEVMPTDLFNLQSENKEGKRSSLKAKRKDSEVIMDDLVSNVEVIPKKPGELVSNTVGDMEEPGEPSSEEDETNFFSKATQEIEAEAAIVKSHSEFWSMGSDNNSITDSGNAVVDESLKISISEFAKKEKVSMKRLIPKDKRTNKPCEVSYRQQPIVQISPEKANATILQVIVKPENGESDKESKEGVDFISVKSAIYGSKEY